MSDDRPELQAAGGAAELIGLLSEQCALFEELANLSATQRSLITGGKPERLLELLGDRQRILDRVQELAVRVRPYQQRWPELRAQASAAEAEEVDRLVGRINGLLGGILEKDQADSQLLAARKSATRQEMSAVRTGRAAGAAYLAAAYGAATQREWGDR